MENKDLMELRNKLAALPAFQKRSEQLWARISEAEKEVASLMSKYEEESMDVERMKAESLSVYIMKLVGKYEGKLDKETEEMLAAKREYDKAVEKVKELKQQRSELDSRLADLHKDKQIYEAELQKREQTLKNDRNSAASQKYHELDEQENYLSQQLVETEEATRAANRVIATAEGAIGHLESAESWATYDIWFSKGLLSHMAKYDHIDNAEETFNRLNFQMDDLRRELKDINISEMPGFSGIDSTTRTIDFWFDNIFTDLNVRDRIREDSEQLRRLRNRIHDVIRMLEGKKSTINGEIAAIRNKRNELIISGSL